MEFLYPFSRQFPFDEVCEQIVRELEKRIWNVPGITITFDSNGEFRFVKEIKGEDFKLYFCRVQRTMQGGRNDIAAVTQILMPRRDLHVFDDESGPRLYLYVGKNWEKDREGFTENLKVHSKLDRKPKTYLEYTGVCNCSAKGGGAFDAIELLEKGRSMRHTHSGRRSPLLVHTNDLGREYDPEGNEPKWFKTAEVMEEFQEYLTEVVLKTITSHPIATEKSEIVGA